MEQKNENVIDIRGNKSLFNVMPVGYQVLLEVEFTKTTLELEVKDLRHKSIRIVGTGSKVTTFEVNDYVYMKPATYAPINVLNKKENCLYYLVEEMNIMAMFSPTTPVEEMFKEDKPGKKSDSGLITKTNARIDKDGKLIN